MPSCIVCHSTRESAESRSEGVRLHRFPARHDLCKQWADFAGVAPGANFKKLFLCTKHFPEVCVVRTSLKVSLKPNAVPSLFVPSSARPDEDSSGNELVMTPLVPDYSACCKNPSEQIEYGFKTPEVQYLLRKRNVISELYQLKENWVMHWQMQICDITSALKRSKPSDILPVTGLSSRRCLNLDL